MIKVSYHEIAEGSTLHFAVVAGGKPLAVFQGKDKKSYKKYFGLMGVEVMRLNGSEANDLAGLKVQMAKEEKPKEDQELFGDPALARTTDPDTSAAAALDVDTNKLERLVYATVAEFGSAGAILDEICDRLPHINQTSISPRIRPLMNKYLLIDTGLRRISNSGRGQRVLVTDKNYHEVQS